MDISKLNLSMNILFYICLFLWIFVSAYCLGSNVKVASIVFIISASLIYIVTYKKF